MLRDRKFSVLIVDDCQEDRETYRRFLQRRNAERYTFLDAATGEDGLRICKTDHPDIVLLDYHLPDLNGLEFLEELRRQGESESPVIVLTGEGNENVAVEAMKLGALDYQTKNGITPEALEHAIENALEKTQLQRRVAQQQI